MNLPKQTRTLSEIEKQQLHEIKIHLQTIAKQPIQYGAMTISLLLTIGAIYLAVQLSNDAARSICILVAIFAFRYALYKPFNWYQDRKKNQQELTQIDDFLTKQTIEVMPIHAIQIAMAEEYEDEGILFLVEVEPHKILYMWSLANDNTRDSSIFPCLDFELYEDTFSTLTGLEINAISEVISWRKRC